MRASDWSRRAVPGKGAEPVGRLKPRLRALRVSGLDPAARLRSGLGNKIGGTIGAEALEQNWGQQIFGSIKTIGGATINGADQVGGAIANGV